MLDERPAGQDDIAAALNTNPVQLLRWADTARPRVAIERRYRDPLRLRWLHGRAIVWRSELEAWRRRNLQGGRDEPKVHGWEKICARVELRRRAAMEAAGRGQDPLPVVRAADGSVWAYESALDEWREARIESRDTHFLLRKSRKLKKLRPETARARETETAARMPRIRQEGSKVSALKARAAA